MEKQKFNLNGNDFPRVDPFVYSYVERESLFVIHVNCLVDEMLDRYTGQHLNLSVISDSALLTGLWMGVEIFLGVAGTILLLREMLKTLAVRECGNLKPEYVFNTSAFQKMSQKCDVLFLGDGQFVEYGPKFEAFLKRHNIV